MKPYNWPESPRRSGRLTAADLDAAIRARDVDPWAVTRFPEQEPDDLNEMQRQAADERMQHAAYMARQAMPVDEDAREPLTRSEGWGIVAMYATSAAAMCAAAYVLWPHVLALVVKP